MSNEQPEKLPQTPVSSDRQPTILAIETATRAGSVSVARGEQILASISGDALSSHSKDLIENVDTVLRQAGTKLSDIDLFAAAVGPGSFTGLRIGLATVKSLAVSLKRKCAGVPTLAAVAYAAGRSERTVALLAAGRGEVFAQMFSVNNNVEPLDEASHIRPVALLAKYGSYSRLLWAGEGAYLQQEFLKSSAEAHGINFHAGLAVQSSAWLLAPQQERLAEAVSMLALQHWETGNLVDAELLRANYIRPSDAEIKSHA